jgi:hypothetical protein
VWFGSYAAFSASSSGMGDAPEGSVAGAASQHEGPCVHVGLEPDGAVQYAPKYESKEWFS